MTQLDWHQILEHIKTNATSDLARTKLSALLPLATPQLALQSVEDIFAAASLIQLGTRPFMESLDLFETWHSRIRKKAVLKTLEIKDVRSFCLETLALTEALQMQNDSWAQGICDRIMNANEPLSAIDQILTPRGDIRSDASETLFRLTREKENLARQVEGLLDRTVNDHQIQNKLQDKYVTTREGRWVLPVKSGMQHFMPGVIHGTSQTKQTVFMEPETIIPLNNRLRQVEVEIEDEIERLLTELSLYLHRLHADFFNSKELLLEMDQVFAKAQWTIQIQGQRFSFTDSKIHLKEVRHPLLLIGGKPVVANSVILDKQKSLLLLSGPNAGGKTVLLKSIGLAAQMARCGLPLATREESELPFFRNIQIGIGDSQSVGEDLSTFAAHLKILEHSLHLTGSDCLILIDEICGSTDPEEGAALARAFIEKFESQNVFAVITSHLGPLKSGWKPESHVLNGSLEYDSQTGRPTYQYLQGIPGDSLAIQTAKRVGVPATLIQRATELLSPETRIRLSGLEEIESLKKDIHTLREHLKKETSKAQFEKDKYEKLREQFNKEKDTELAKVVRQGQKKIDEMIQLAKAETVFKKHTALQEIKTNLPEIIKSKSGRDSRDSDSPNRSSGPLTAEEFGQRFPPGSKVFIPTLQQDGITQSLPNGKGEVFVLSQSLRLALPWSELKSPQIASNPTAQLLRRSGGFSLAPSDQEKILDVRGKTVEESISLLEIELDRAVTFKNDRLKVIHGHGTEALKKAVRAYLSRSVYVKKWKAGTSESGGDGMTWVELATD